MNSSVLLWSLGGSELIVIVVIIVLLFGGKKIPELMKGMGRGIREFKEGQKPEKPEDKDKDKDH